MAASIVHGKICFIEIPALDMERSADFYEKVFGRRIRRRGATWADFEDSTGQVSGRLVKARIAHETPGFLIRIMVENTETTVAAVLASGGEITRPIAPRRAPLIARIRDPAGNVIGLYAPIDDEFHFCTQYFRLSSRAPRIPAFEPVKELARALVHPLPDAAQRRSGIYEHLRRK